MSTVCNVIVGTYEKLILGYELSQEPDDKWSFKIKFTNNSHLAPVRCLAVSPTRGILASAGSDEAIRLLDLKQNVEVGSLPYHSGSVNALHFYKASHLFSCSDDGKLVVWRRRDWRMLKAFKRHRGQAVKGVAVHPTGALALSVGNDKTLRTWDLVAGKNAFSINLKQPAQAVMWSTKGSYFAVVFKSWIDVYSAATGRICAALPESSEAKNSSIIPPSKKITTATFISDETVVFATESGKLGAANMSQVSNGNVKVIELQAHNVRIKGIDLATEPIDNVAYVLTASSDGEIRLWKYDMTGNDENFELLASHRTDFRILSMAVWHTAAASSTTAQPKVKAAKLSAAKAKLSERGNKSSPKELKKSKKQPLKN